MTRIALEESFTPGFPVVKRTRIGETFTGAVLKVESRDRLKRAVDGSMQPILKANGRHAQELVVTCLTLPGTDAPAGIGDEEGVPAPGDIVRLILKGKAYGDWIEAKRSMPGRSVAVGDVVSQTTTVAQVYDAQGSASGPEITDQKSVDTARAKGRSVGIYGPLTLRVGADDEVAKAEVAYRSLHTLDGDGDAATAPANGPARPAKISEAAWAAMDASTRTAVAATMSSVSDETPPF